MSAIPLLIVEDNPVYAEVLQRLLPTLGTEFEFEVAWVDTAEKAKEIVHQKAFSIVLLDYRLPTADGLTVLAEIQTLPVGQQPAVIMLTGMGCEEIAVEAMKRGAKDYLSKDQLDIASLLRAITSALERRRLEEQLQQSTEQLRAQNAQLQADLNMAREIQEAFLPQSYPTFPAQVAPEQSALRFCHRYIPTTVVGGDFFDVKALPGGQASLFISDVMGHGVRAALVTAILHAVAEELTAVAANPGAFLDGMNQRLMGVLQRTRMPMFASACHVVMDPQAGVMRFALAGHPPPIHVQRRLARVEPLAVTGGETGPALGLFSDAQFRVFTAPLSPNDAVVLYTDGVFEVNGPDGSQYGQERLLHCLRQHAHMQTSQLFDEVINEVQRYADRKEFADDVCLLGADVAHAGGA